MSKTKTEWIRLRIEQRKRILVPREEANAAIDHATGPFLMKLSGLAARATRDLHARRAIDNVIFEIRTDARQHDRIEEPLIRRQTPNSSLEGQRRLIF